MASVIIATPIKLIKTPVLTSGLTRIRPEPNIIAFGGVATGSIKAHEADRIAGIISISGFIFIATDKAAGIGRIIWVVAVFEVNSVRNVINKQMTIIINIGGNCLKPVNWAPSQVDKPECSNPAASAKPPPNNITFPHGSLTAVCQSMTLPFPLFRAGIRKNKRAIVIDTVPSSINDASGNSPDQPGMDIN